MEDTHEQEQSGDGFRASSCPAELVQYRPDQSMSTATHGSLPHNGRSVMTLPAHQDRGNPVHRTTGFRADAQQTGQPVAAGPALSQSAALDPSFPVPGWKPRERDVGPCQGPTWPGDGLYQQDLAYFPETVPQDQQWDTQDFRSTTNLPASIGEQLPAYQTLDPGAPSHDPAFGVSIRPRNSFAEHSYHTAARDVPSPDQAAFRPYIPGPGPGPGPYGPTPTAHPQHRDLPQGFGLPPSAFSLHPADEPYPLPTQQPLLLHDPDAQDYFFDELLAEAEEERSIGAFQQQHQQKQQQQPLNAAKLILHRAESLHRAGYNRSLPLGVGASSPLSQVSCYHPYHHQTQIQSRVPPPPLRGGVGGRKASCCLNVERAAEGDDDYDDEDEHAGFY